MKGVGKTAILVQQSKEANIGESGPHHKTRQLGEYCSPVTLYKAGLNLKIANSP